MFSYRVFLTIVEHSSFQKAAELHNVTPPAVSHMVKQMEQTFGFPLFIRNRSGVTLTTAGESIYGYIRDIVLKENLLQQQVDALNGLQKGHVKLGIFNSMCNFFPNLIINFNKDYPQITFEIFQGSYEDIIDWVKNSVVDIGFFSRTVNPGLPFYEVFSDPLMCIFNKDTETESDSEVRLESLANYQFVMQRESCDADARKLMDSMNLDVRTVCHVVDDKTTVEMVKCGFGFAIMPLLTMNGFEKEVKMLPIVPETRRVIGASVRDTHDLSPAVKKVLEYIKHYDFSI